MWTEPIRLWLAALPCCLSLALPLQGAETAAPEDLVAARRCATYAPASMAELRRAEAAFRDLLQRREEAPATPDSAWKELGFETLRVTDNGVTWQVLREARGHCRGQGLYLIREGAAPELMLQVPHGYHDLHTDEIALRLARTPVRVLAFNSVPRRYSRRGEARDADLAQREDSFFVALTRAFAATFPTGRIVQLHGFSREKRTTPAGAGAAVIVSAGTRWPSPGTEAVAACLQAQVDAPVRLYPRDVRELGGTGNLQGRILRGLAHSGFVHVELSRAMRERLQREDTLSARFARCLSSGMDTP